MGRLAKAYLRHRTQGGPVPDEAPLEAALADALAEGRRAFPSVELAPELLVRHLSERWPSLPDPALRAADLYLACACSHGVDAAIAILDEGYLARIPAFVTRSADAGDIGDEVRQQLRQRLLVDDGGRPGRIVDYRGRGSLDSWLRAAATRLALNLLRADQRQRRARQKAAAEAQLVLADPETEYMKSLHRPQLEQAVRAAFAAVGARDRAVLRLRYVEGVGIGRIAISYGVHRATVSRWLDEAQRGLFHATRAALRDLLDLSTTECESLIGLLRSRLEVALSTVLARSSKAP
jgi:RNA polymerase sigma-70 factor (ECF subfamily)